MGLTLRVSLRGHGPIRPNLSVCAKYTYILGKPERRLERGRQVGGCRWPRYQRRDEPSVG